MEAEKENDGFPVWKENFQTVVMFLKCTTQWRVSFGGFVGLDYTAVKVLLDIYQVKKHRQMFEDLQLMERAALQVLNKKADK